MDPQDLETMLDHLRRTQDEIEARLAETQDKDIIETTQRQDSSVTTPNNGNIMNSFGDYFGDDFGDDFGDECDDDPTMECKLFDDILVFSSIVCILLFDMK